MKGEHVVVDASAVTDLLVATDIGLLLDMRLEGCVLHAPTQIDAEVLEGMDKLTQTGLLTPYRALQHLDALAASPIERHPVFALFEGAWRRRYDMSLSAALYLELARLLGLALITTDRAMAEAGGGLAELIALERAA